MLDPSANVGKALSRHSGNLRFFAPYTPVVAAVAAAVAALSIGYNFTGSIGSAWHVLLVPSMPQPFSDLQAITHALDCAAKGIDPYAHICDPYGRPLNYPAAWLLLKYLGLGSKQTNLIGCALIVMEVMAFLMIFRTRNRIGRRIVFFAVLSPPVLLGLERGNCDIIVFCLLVFAVFAAQRFSVSARKTFLGTSISVLAALKLFPIAALASLFNQRRDVFQLLLWGAFGLLLVFMTSSRSELRAVYSGTPFGSFGMYGSGGILLAASRVLALQMQPIAIRMLSLALAVLVAIGGMLYAARNPSRHGLFPVLTENDAASLLAVAGLAIFCLTFCLGTNYSYRLIFLIGTIPALLKAYENNSNRTAAYLLVGLIAFLWSFLTVPPQVFEHIHVVVYLYYPIYYVINVLGQWAVFAWASGWLGSMMYRGIRMR